MTDDVGKFAASPRLIGERSGQGSFGSHYSSFGEPSCLAKRTAKIESRRGALVSSSGEEPIAALSRFL